MYRRITNKHILVLVRTMQQDSAFSSYLCKSSVLVKRSQCLSFLLLNFSVIFLSFVKVHKSVIYSLRSIHPSDISLYISYSTHLFVGKKYIEELTISLNVFSYQSSEKWNCDQRFVVGQIVSTRLLQKCPNIIVFFFIPVPSCKDYFN